jgi:hypothetical protein
MLSIPICVPTAAHVPMLALLRQSTRENKARSNSKIEKTRCPLTDIGFFDKVSCIRTKKTDGSAVTAEPPALKINHYEFYFWIGAE